MASRLHPDARLVYVTPAFDKTSFYEHCCVVFMCSSDASQTLGASLMHSDACLVFAGVSPNGHCRLVSVYLSHASGTFGASPLHSDACLVFVTPAFGRRFFLMSMVVWCLCARLMLVRLSGLPVCILMLVLYL